MEMWLLWATAAFFSIILVDSLTVMEVINSKELIDKYSDAYLSCSAFPVPAEQITLLRERCDAEDCTSQPDGATEDREFFKGLAIRSLVNNDFAPDDAEAMAEKACQLGFEQKKCQNEDAGIGFLTPSDSCSDGDIIVGTFFSSFVQYVRDQIANETTTTTTTEAKSSQTFTDDMPSETASGSISTELSVVPDATTTSADIPVTGIGEPELISETTTTTTTIAERESSEAVTDDKSTVAASMMSTSTEPGVVPNAMTTLADIPTTSTIDEPERVTAQPSTTASSVAPVVADINVPISPPVAVPALAPPPRTGPLVIQLIAATVVPIIVATTAQPSATSSSVGPVIVDIVSPFSPSVAASVLAPPPRVRQIIPFTAPSLAAIIMTTTAPSVAVRYVWYCHQGTECVQINDNEPKIQIHTYTSKRACEYACPRQMAPSRATRYWYCHEGTECVGINHKESKLQIHTYISKQTCEYACSIPMAIPGTISKIWYCKGGRQCVELCHHLSAIITPQKKYTQFERCRIDCNENTTFAAMGENKVS